AQRRDQPRHRVANLPRALRPNRRRAGRRHAGGIFRRDPQGLGQVGRRGRALGRQAGLKSMSRLLEGHIAAVTGAGSGIGRATARGSATAGPQVVTPAINADTAAQTSNAIREAGGTAWSFRLDVTERDACRQAADEVGETIGDISILVNNAGINRRNAFTAAPEAVVQDWQDLLSVNLIGVFNVTHAFLAQLRATRGRIINIASVQSFMHVRTPNSAAYTASKHGVLGLTRALAAELGKDGVRVNAIGPGLIETPLN